MLLHQHYQFDAVKGNVSSRAVSKIRLAVNTCDWTFASKISAILDTHKAGVPHGNLRVARPLKYLLSVLFLSSYKYDIYHSSQTGD